MRKRLGPLATLPGASRQKNENPMADARAEFMKRWIPMGVDLWARCEGHGIDWRNHKMEELPFLCSLAEGC